MGIQKIEMYKTSDGKKFSSIDEASKHEQELDSEPALYIFQVTVQQSFTSPYEVEEEDSSEGLERARQEVIRQFEEGFGQVRIHSGKDWDCWEAEGPLKVLNVELEDLG